MGGDSYADDWSRGAGATLGQIFNSPMAGTVIFAGQGGDIYPAGVYSFGNQVIVRSSENSTFAFRVAHLSLISVSVGQTVSAGTKLGEVGSTGNSTGAHAHCVLYKNLDQTYGTLTGLQRLQGGYGFGYSGAANQFAAAYYFNAVSTTLLPAPALISPINGGGGQSTAPTFSWSDVTGSDSGYRIMVATNAADLPTDPMAVTGGASVIINATPTTNTYTPSTALTPGTTYYWEVHGRSSAYFGTWSSKNSFTTASADTTKPTFSAFDVSPTNVASGNSVTISYTVSDSGGSGLNMAQLWRTSDSAGIPNDANWQQIGLSQSLVNNGNGPVSKSFTDTPSVGIYWYGIHADDNSTTGNTATETTSGFIPKKVTVTQTGSLQVNIAPAGAVNAGAQWQVDGGALQSSGATVNNLSVGNHTVTFKTISGWTTPNNVNVTVNANQTATTTGTYVVIPQTGSLQVSIAPSGAVNVGAQWQVDGGTFQSNGATVSGLSVGNHTVAFKATTGWTTPVNQTLTVNANLTTTTTGTYVVLPPQTGSLQVNIAPAGAVNAGAQWQVDGGAFQSSGATVSGLSVATHTVAFSAIGGWTTPGSLTVTINANQKTDAVGTYVQGAGSLQVTFGPQGAIDAGAQWQVDGGAYRGSGETVNGLSVGGHTVAFKAISGWTTPGNQVVTVSANQTTTLTDGYIAISIYRVTPSAGSNGSIDPSTPRTVNSGGSITFTATPISGYGVDQWLVNGSLLRTGGSSFKLDNVIGDTTVQVTFKIIPSQPNLTPYQPDGWSDKIVVAKTNDTTQNNATDSSSLSSSDALYVSWAQRNNGSDSTVVTFNTELLVDGVNKASWPTSQNLSVNGWNYVSGYPLGTLPPGTHTITIRTDSTGKIAEIDETDNEYTKTITVASPLPHQPDLWIGNGVGDLIGDGDYDWNAVGQTHSSKLARGGVKTYLVKVENDGPETNNFTIHSYGSSLGFNVKIFDSGVNITSQATGGGGYTMANLAPGESRYLTVRVKAKSTAAVGAVLKRWFNIVYTDDNTIRDSVMLKVRAQ